MGNARSKFTDEEYDNFEFKAPSLTNINPTIKRELITEANISKDIVQDYSESGCDLETIAKFNLACKLVREMTTEELERLFTFSKDEKIGNGDFIQFRAKISV